MDMRIFQTNRSRIKTKASELLSRIKARNKGIEDAETQDELGELINNISYIAKRGDMFLLDNAEIAVNSAISEKPEIRIIKKINEHLSHRKKPPYEKMTPSTRVIFGLALCLYAAVSFLSIRNTGTNIPDTFFGIDTSLMLLVAGCGAIGSIVSIMARVGEFYNLKSNDIMVHMFMGLFKPLIGSAFAIFVFSTIKAGVIPIAVGEGAKEALLFMSIGFLSGFSERFATDFTGKAEKVLVGKDG